MIATKPKPIMRDVPTIEEQAAAFGWKAGIVDFGRAMKKGVDYFNCSTVERPDGRWLIVRRSKWSDNDKMGFNDLMAFSLDGIRPLMGYKINLEPRFPIEHFEDPRAMFHNGKTYISCCNFIRNGKGCCYPHQIICEVDEKWNLVKRHDPVYGHNGNDTAKNTLHEKNWCVFFHKPEPMQNESFKVSVTGSPYLPAMVYHSNPHTVVQWDWDFKNPLTWKSPWDASIWQHGQIRGGTPPVLVNGEYWTFFHSSKDIPVYRRQYHMGCYAFEARPPFRITKITLEPLLSGSRYDRSSAEKPLVVFPNGALHKDGKWTVVGGSNDLDCFYCEIPHEELVGQMIELT